MNRGVKTRGDVVDVRGECLLIVVNLETEHDWTGCWLVTDDGLLVNMNTHLTTSLHYHILGQADLLIVCHMIICWKIKICSLTVFEVDVDQSKELFTSLDNFTLLTDTFLFQYESLVSQHLKKLFGETGLDVVTMILETQ